MQSESNQTIIPFFSVRINRFKCMASIIMVLASVVLGITADASLKAQFVLGTGYVVLAFLQFSCSRIAAKRLYIIWYLCSAPVTLALTQLLLNHNPASLELHKIFLGCLCVGILINFLFLITRNIRAAVTIGMLVALLLTSANYFVFSFRGSEMAPYDFLAIGTAAEVAGQYEYTIEPPFAYAWSIAGLYLLSGYCFPSYPFLSKKRLYYFCTLTELIAVCVLILGLGNIEKRDYRNEGTIQNGYLLNFVKRIDFTPIEVPDGYSIDVLSEYEDLYRPKTQTASTNPDVIVIMNESFSDFQIIGELHTDVEVTPFFDSLLKETIHGYALASSIGGGTCNSEYQFLTGNNMGFLSDGSYPYQQYINPSAYSIFSKMEEYGYINIATHPEQGKNWMRATVWPYFGVDQTYFIDAYPQENMLRLHVSDQEMYEKVVQLYEAAHTSSEQVFLFGVTMQNHGGYLDENFVADVHLAGYQQSYPDVEQYLTLIHRSDNALSYLINYFEGVERDVVVLFFGDHLPQFSSTFYHELHGGTFDTLEEQMLQYTVPFFVWANFDIEEQDVGLTSLNFLSNYVYEAAGLPLPAYNAFLKDIQSVIPAMNAFGYYSKANGTIIPYEDAEGDEAEALNRYRILQYNSMFDEENRSQVFFPTSVSETP